MFARKPATKLSALALAVGLSVSAQATPHFSNVYSFGDSLSDMGTQVGTGIPGVAQIGNIYTTPGGKTAAGHLALNFGHESVSATKMQLNLNLSDLNTVFNVLLPAIQVAQISTTSQNLNEMFKDSPEGASPQAEKLKGLSSKLDALLKIPSSADGYEQARLEAEAIHKEIRREIMSGAIAQAGASGGKLIDYISVDKKGNNFAVGGAATSVSNATDLDIGFTKAEIEKLVKESLPEDMANNPIVMAFIEGVLKGLKDSDKINITVPMQQPSLADQVDRYLARGNGQADPNALYTITAGANDLFRLDDIIKMNTLEIQQAGADKAKEVADSLAKQGMASEAIAAQAELAGKQASAAKVQALAQPHLISATQEVASQIGRLQNAGAKYVVVTNMPDVDLTPSYNGKSAEEKQVAQSAVNGFNSLLNMELSKLNKGVIYGDINAFLKDVVNNPVQYGFTKEQVSKTFCSGSSSMCSVSAADSISKEALELAGVDTAQVKAGKTTLSTEQMEAIKEAADKFIFADGVHPTNYVHQMFANLLTSYLYVPEYVGAQQALANQGQQRLTRQFAGRRDLLAVAPLQEGEFRPYVSVDGSRSEGARYKDNIAKGDVDSASFNLGMEYGFSDRTSAGVMLTVQRDEQDFSSNLKGEQTREAVVGGGYLSQQINSNWHWGFHGYMGQGDYDLTRKYDLSATVHQKAKSSTESLIVGAGAMVGGHYQLQNWQLQPRLELNQQYEKLDAYTEKTGVTPQRVDAQELSRTELVLGSKVSYPIQFSSAKLVPFADLSWSQHIAGDKDLEASWKTASSGGKFVTQKTAPAEQSYGLLQVGSEMALGENLYGSLTYRHQFASKLNNDKSVNLGIEYRF